MQNREPVNTNLVQDELTKQKFSCQFVNKTKFSHHILDISFEIASSKITGVDNY